MSNSSLASFIKISPNSNHPRNHVIDTVTVHCFVGQVSIESMGHYFASKLNKCSANYGIGADGRIGMFVEEKDRSWCSSSGTNDNRAITIECACDTFHPYKVNDSVLNSLIELLADICKRNGIKELKWSGDKSLIGKVDMQNMTVHRWFKNKACPGEYLYNKHPYIAEEVNKRIIVSVAPVQQAPQPTPKPQPTPSDSIIKNAIVGSWQNSMNIGFDLDDENKLKVDNSFGPKSQALATKHQMHRYIKGCSTAIKWLQNRLKELGFYTGRIDGKFEDGTYDAVVALEKARGLTPSGWVGVKVTTELLK